MIVDTIKDIVNNLSKPCGFFYANTLEEVNFDLDKYDGDRETFFAYIAPLEVDDDISEGGLIYTRFPLYFFMMHKFNHKTIDYESVEVDPMIEEMRDLSREFIHSLNGSDIVIKSGGPDGTYLGIEKTAYKNVYAWMDIHLFGVSCETNVPIFENKTGCI